MPDSILSNWNLLASRMFEDNGVKLPGCVVYVDLSAFVHAERGAGAIDLHGRHGFQRLDFIPVVGERHPNGRVRLGSRARRTSRSEHRPSAGAPRI